MKVTTHNGQFHADEVTAYTIIRKIFPQCKLIRTRDENIIEEANIAIDVGQIYDPENNRFDHHQQGCHERFNRNVIIDMSSAGMVYKKFGKELIEKYLKENIDINGLHTLYQNIYHKFILEIDAIDNGYKLSHSKLNYHINTNISGTVRRMNNMDNVYDEEKQLELFFKASEYVELIMDVIIKDEIRVYFGSKRDYRTIYQAFQNRFKLYESGEIILVSCDCPNWLKSIYEYEKKHPYKFNQDSVKYIIYSAKDEWRVRTVSKNFTPRRLIKTKECYPENIKKNVTFVHTKQFIAATKDKNTAIQVAIFSLKD